MFETPGAAPRGSSAAHEWAPLGASKDVPLPPPVRDELWAWPGHPRPAPPPPEPDPSAVALVDLVDTLLGQEPSALPGLVALERARTVLTQLDRLGLVAATALVDVADRDLFAADGAGSVGSWLRQQPSGDGGRMARAQRLQSHPLVRSAVATGVLGLSSADVVCRALGTVPAACGPGQVEGVLAGAVPDLLARWIGGMPREGGDPVSEARAAVVQEVVDAGVAATGSPPAERLEPAFTLLGQALAPGVLADQLQLLVDALQPERLEDAEAEAHLGRRIRLRQKRSAPGWKLAGDLTDEVGATLHAELEARARGRRQAEAALVRAMEEGSDAAGFGAVGPGTPADGRPTDGLEDLPGAPLLSDEQLAHDLLAELLDDLAGVREPGAPQPAAFTVVAGLDALEGGTGALPGTVLLPDGPSPLSLSALRRAGCDGLVNAVLLDAARRPVGASGTHRHATERERRALRALWGDYCAGNGCTSTRTVPQHVRPWWMSGRTALEDLIPLCKGNHHDVHDGHRTLLLRDGRLIDEFGWVTRPQPDGPDAAP